MAIIDGISVSGTTYGLRDNDTNGGIASTFSASTAYTAGQYVWYDSGSGAKLYRFTADHAAGAWIGTDATEVKLGEVISDLSNAVGLINDMAFISNTFDYSEVVVSGYTINQNNKWAFNEDDTGSHSKTFEIPAGINFIKVSPNVNGSIIAFLSSNSRTAGHTPAFSTNYQARIILDSDQVYKIESDMKYLYALYTDSSDNDKIPTVTLYTTTDKTLTEAGKAADAKATGDSFNDIKNTITDITGNTEITNWSENKKYIKLDGDTATVDTPTTTTSNVHYAVVSASEGDEFTITATGGSASRAYGFVASDGTILKKAGADATLTKEIVTAPANTAYLVINDTSLTGRSYVGGLDSVKIEQLESAITLVGNNDYFTSLILCPDAASNAVERRRYIKRGNSIAQERTSSTANTSSRTVFFTGSELMVFSGNAADAVPTANQLVDVALLTPAETDRRAVIDYYIDGKQPAANSSTSGFYIYYCTVSEEVVTVVSRVKVSPMIYFAKSKGFYRHWISIPTGATHFALGVTTNYNGCEFCMTVELSHALVSDEQNIAPVINQFVADTDLYVNDYRIINGQLYRVTADVATGAALTVNTNIVATDVCTEIYEIPHTATTTLFGYNVPGNAALLYGISANYISVLKTAMDAWMTEYSGDTRKVPFILHTDQHGQLKLANKGYFDLISHLANWEEVSAVFNLGDTVQDHWSDSAVTANPLQRNSELESATKTQSSIPSEKRINVWGNHDTWYSGDVETAVSGILPSFKYLNPYFPATGLRTVRLPDNSGNMVVYDDAYMVRYLVVANWDYADRASPTYQKFFINADHWKWIIKELSTDCGYDLVIVSHVPLLINGPKCYDPITYESKASTATYICPDLSYSADVFAARKAKTSGTITVESETIAYDFTNCTDHILCAIAGHQHADRMDWTGDLLCATFNRFGPTSRMMFFALFDRENEKLVAWEVANGDTPTATRWEAPFDYTAPPTPSQS